ncbi:ArdC family protein [Hufsiella ginkgonis]|uniref:DUF1738 domain-containing protein n=1 Tax=Hufsiella ginkgonis TaxID=2695274 RepID=A0A7K1Y1A3_9SPHI|nr:zincin-like metallopeptidase domain-containing protein [Hufsiella ginkgonis]MXV16897.1 DUF1738 domain-containing protein [Hufsiella ginkgonis]
MEHAAAKTETIKAPRKDLHQEVTDTIIRQLENGVIPWQQPWKDFGQPLRLPVNFVTGNKYQGINTLMLWTSSIEQRFSSNEWATFKQWASKEEFPRKGQRGSMIVYYSTFEKENEDGETENIPFLKSSYVFNRCQLTSYERPKRPVDEYAETLFDKIPPVEAFIENTQAVIEHGSDEACYHHIDDKIYMPYRSDFTANAVCTATEGYYSVILHELTHWTGHSDRLARGKGKRFSDWDYAVEELVAELGSAFMCADFGIATIDKGNHSAYISSWLKALRENKRYIFTAASEANKAVEYLKKLQVN